MIPKTYSTEKEVPIVDKEATIKILEHDENREQGYRSVMVADENAAASFGGLYEVDQTEFESLKGPQDKKWVEFDQLISVEIDFEDDFESLEKWYFSCLDKIRDALLYLMDKAKDGEIIHRQSIYDFANLVYDLDAKAEDAGWTIYWEPIEMYPKLGKEGWPLTDIGYDKSGYTRIARDKFHGNLWEKVDHMTLEAKQERFRKMKERQLLFLNEIGQFKGGTFKYNSAEIVRGARYYSMNQKEVAK